MEDKDFLGYFNKLGPPSTSLDIKAAASNIVNTLVGLGSVPGRRASTDSSSKAMEAAEIAIKAKYTTGDLGDKVSADLNYTLKRLVRGLYSENHTVKQGFFLASVLVLSRFKGQIDLDKYLKHVFNETKVSSQAGAVKSSEINNMSLGRMMCMSACVEARIFISTVGVQVNQRTLKVLVACLVELYSQHEFL